MVNEEKERKLQELRKKFSEIADAVGAPIDKGIFEVIVLLNALGWSTSASCEGDALPYAWINFDTPEEIKQKELEAQGKSVYWKVHKDARDSAERNTEEKFGKEYIESLTYWTEEIRTYWMNEYTKARDAHKEIQEYSSIHAIMQNQSKDLCARIEALKDEFLKSIHEKSDELYIEPGINRLNFATEEVVAQTEVGESPEIHARSSELLQKFEKFLKEKYANR